MKMTRRKFIGNIAISGAVIATFSLVACKGGEKNDDKAKESKPTGEAKPESMNCSDTSKLTEADKKTRTALKYKDSTTDGRTCESCTLYVNNASGCGGCKIIKGPINPKGTCMSYAKKA